MQNKIVGVPFDNWVADQIEHRQKILGKTQRTAEELQYLNNKSSWVRVASSIDISDEEIANGLGLSQGNRTAKDFVLFGGSISVNDNLSYQAPLGGVIPNEGLSLSEASKYSYGFGSREYGYTPPPGIDSLKIVHKNRGSIRDYTLKLKAQNLDQFKVIDTLYLRLGYFLLIEWGHTSYFYKPNGESNYAFQNSPDFVTPAFSDLFEGSKDDIIDSLEKQRVKTSGNYDGGLVKVKNFSWSFNEDGSYDITINAVSIGGLIDSLLLNFQGPNVQNVDPTRYVVKNLTPTQKKDEAINLGEELPEGENVDRAFDRLVSKFLGRKGGFQTLIKNGIVEDAETSVGGKSLNKLVFDDFAGTIFANQYKSLINDFLLVSVLNLKAAEWSQTGDPEQNRYKRLNDGELVSIKFENGGTKNKSQENYYVRFDALIRFINEKVIPLNFSNQSTDDSELGEVENMIVFSDQVTMFTHWFQGSSDPHTCVVPFTYIDPEDNQNPRKIILSQELGVSFRLTDSQYVANLSKIHINLECIAQILDQLEGRDEEGNVSLFLFLDELLSRLNKALGNINSFSVLYDEATNQMFIQDDTVKPGESGVDELATPIRVYGTNIIDGQGSFVRNVSMLSQLTPNTAKEVAIGAVATGTNLNNSTSQLGRWNYGFVDRLQEKDTSSSTTAQEGNNILTRLNTTYTRHINFIKSTYEDYKSPTSNDVNVAKADLFTLLQYDLNIKTINGEVPGKGFIPISLQLSLDGLSGVLLYQKFRLTPNILPPSYDESIDFIIKSIDHTITGNEWVTSYSTVSAVKFRPIKGNLEPREAPEGEFSLLTLPTNS